MIREVKEETGLNVTPIKKLLAQPADIKVSTVAFWYAALKPENGPIVLNEESSRSGWFTVDEALELRLYPGTRIFLQKLRVGEIVWPKASK